MRPFQYLTVLLCALFVIGLGVLVFRPLSTVTPPDETGAPEEAVPVTVVTPDSWIGVSLGTAQAVKSDEIREPTDEVVIRSVLPGTPADGLLKVGDVVMNIEGKPVGTPHDFIGIVHSSPAGQPLSLLVRRDQTPNRTWIAVKVTPEERPSYESLVARLFVGKPLPSLGSKLSTADTDRNGVIEGSQTVVSKCLSKKGVDCPDYTFSKTSELFTRNFSTLLVVWSPQSDASTDTLKVLKTDARFQHHDVMLVTWSSPRTLVDFFKNDKRPRPSAKVVVVVDGDAETAPSYEQLTKGTVLVVDKDGVVTDVSDGSAASLDNLAQRLNRPRPGGSH